VVTREELRQALWPPDTFVDFDNGINTAVNKLREALGDSAENPRFVETFGRRGYRWLPEVTRSSEPEQFAPGEVGGGVALEGAPRPSPGQPAKAGDLAVKFLGSRRREILLVAALTFALTGLLSYW
jgi:hypothetical protein